MDELGYFVALVTRITRLIINFIVPWGNFQVYLIRPDADEGPFSSQHKNRPSERAWTKFMEGSAVSEEILMCSLFVINNYLVWHQILYKSPHLLCCSLHL